MNSSSRKLLDLTSCLPSPPPPPPPPSYELKIPQYIGTVRIEYVQLLQIMLTNVDYVTSICSPPDAQVLKVRILSEAPNRRLGMRQEGSESEISLGGIIGVTIGYYLKLTTRRSNLSCDIFGNNTYKCRAYSKFGSSVKGALSAVYIHHTMMIRVGVTQWTTFQQHVVIFV